MVKTKSFIVVLSFAMFTILYSCNTVQDPDMWKVEIEDSFKFQMAKAMTYTAAVYMDLNIEDEIDEAVKTIEKSAFAIIDEKTDKWESDVAKYELALEKFHNKDEIYNALWQAYHEYDGEVKFSTFTQQPKEGEYSVWTATEKNSDIRVTFKINKFMDWELEFDEKDLQAYIASKICEELMDDL